MGPEDLYSTLTSGSSPITPVPAPVDYSQLLGLTGLNLGAQDPGAAVDSTQPEPVVAPEAPVVPVAPQPAQPPQSQAIAAPQLPRQLAQGQSLGFGVSQSGYSPGAYAAVQKNVSGVDRQINAERGAVEQSFAPIQAAGKEANLLGQQAIERAAQIEAEKIAEIAEGHRKIAEAQQGFQTAEAAAVSTAKAEAATAKLQYRAALADYAAAQINPAQLWEAAGAGGQVAMIATAFAHDFLGAKGIQTSGLDSINRAIQNNINAQLENMRKKQDVAQGFKQLWDMQRAESATDAEARQRLNGFYLAALSSEIESKLGSYDSGLALQKAQAAKAALMQEQVKNDTLVQKYIDDAANQRAGQRIDIYKANLSASMSRYGIDSQEKMAKMALEAKNQFNPLLGAVVDTSESGDGTIKRRFLPGIPDAKQAEITTNTAKSIDTVKNIQKLIELQDAIDKTPPTDLAFIKKMQSEAQRAAEQVRNLVRMGLIYDNSGKAINEQEMKVFNEIIGKKDWWLNGDNTRALAIAAEYQLDKTKAVLQATSYALQPGDPAYGAKVGSTDNFAESESILTNIQAQPGSGKPGPSPAKDTIKAIHSPDSLDTADFEDKNPIDKVFDKAGGKSDAFEKSVKKDFEEFKEAHPQHAKDKVDKAFLSMAALATYAARGDKAAADELNRLANYQPPKPYRGPEVGVALAPGEQAPASAAGYAPATEQDLEQIKLNTLLRDYAQWEKTTRGVKDSK